MMGSAPPRPNEGWPMRMRLLPCLLVAACVAVGPAAWANSRGVRGVTIPAPSCVSFARDSNSVPIPSPGYWAGQSIIWYTLPTGSSIPETIFLTCPVPINSIDLGGTTTRNTLTSYQILYQDND